MATVDRVPGAEVVSALAGAAPTFTLVSAVHDVERYLPDFIASIEQQTAGLDHVQVVVVDDGSTDGSGALLREWQRRRPDLVTVLTQANAGQASARNAGLRVATGEWVGFPDPDDALDPRYLERVAAFLLAHPEAHLVAANRWIWNDGSEPRDTHPLRYLFRGDHLVDLVADGQHFQGSAPATFFRAERLRELDLTFDTRVRPIFEDGHFTCRYLLSYERPLAGFLGSAHYHYRKRGSRDSTLQTARAHPGRYTDVLEHGYLDVVRRAVERHGRVPHWLQNHLVFDLSGYFTRTDSYAPVGAPTSGETAERMHALMARILDHLDLDEVVPHTWAPVRRVPRYVLQHAYRDACWREPHVLLGRLDRDRRLVEASWFFTGDPVKEEFRADGVPVEPLHAKTRAYAYAGRVLLRRRVVWLPADRTLEVRRDGVAAELVLEPPAFPMRSARPAVIDRGAGDRPPAAGMRAAVVGRARRAAARASRRLPARRRFHDAWVLMDRIHDAGDSAEILFHHLRERHPEINAWFVLERGTPDWERLHPELGDRLVAHGSVRWRLLMAEAAHLISSHADDAVVRPPAITSPRWRNHFLNHGVIKDDLSAWLNRKDLATLVTSTRQEYASIAGDDTAYDFTTREVRLTGMPRLDRLHRVGLRFPPDRRDLVVVAPTWRHHLVPPLEAGSQRRAPDRTLLDSDFFRCWWEFLAHPGLAEACTRHGVRLGFLPHPNLQPLLPAMDLPTHVEPLAYDGHDVQEYFARARVLVTDFSSVAFNAAYLERPVVYHQFDEDVVLGGGHVGRRGYFDYRRDGFGPVTTTADAAADAVVDALVHGPRPQPEYQARIDATFPDRDGGCCARVVEAVLASTRPHGAPTPTPVMPGTVTP